jgi:hypothetical protein
LRILRNKITSQNKTEEPVKSCKIILHLLQFLFHKTQQKAYEDKKLQKACEDKKLQKSLS